MASSPPLLVDMRLRLCLSAPHRATSSLTACVMLSSDCPPTRENNTRTQKHTCIYRTLVRACLAALPTSTTQTGSWRG